MIPWELRISADFRILPQQESIVRAETAGTVDEIFVTEGAHVIAGDLIARLYDPDKEKELSFVEGELAKKRAELAQLRAGHAPRRSIRPKRWSKRGEQSWQTWAATLSFASISRALLHGLGRRWNSPFPKR